MLRIYQKEKLIPRNRASLDLNLYPQDKLKQANMISLHAFGYSQNIPLYACSATRNSVYLYESNRYSSIPCTPFCPQLDSSLRG